MRELAHEAQVTRKSAVLSNAALSTVADLVEYLPEIRSSPLILRLGAQSSYIVMYFEGSNAVKTTSICN